MASQNNAPGPGGFLPADIIQEIVQVNFRFMIADAAQLRSAARRLDQIASGVVVERSHWLELAQAKAEHDTLIVEFVRSFARIVDPDFYR